MRNATTRPQTIAVPALVAAALLGILSASAPAADPEPATPKPARKDSNPRIRPKEVTLTPAVTPAAVKAGAKVTYQVKAKLEPGWHIYTYAAKEPVGGPARPRFTTFELFDPGGLKIAGEWTAEKPPIRHKEPAFPDLDYLEFYEDEVTWSIKLLVPPGTAPGPKTLRCQAGYQICNDQTCKIPGQWTLPDVILTVVPGVAEAEAEPAPPAAPAAPPTVVALSDVARPSADPAPTSLQPVAKDSNPRFRPKEVTLTPTVTPAEARAGAKVTYQVKARLEPGWHIYTYVQKEPIGGPLRPRFTTFDLFDSGGLKPVGDWTASKPPVRQKKPTDFPGLEFLDYHENEVTWSTQLQVPLGTEPGSRTLRCQAGYMICNDKTCSVPGQWTLPDVVLTVVPGVAEAEVEAAPPVAGTPPADEVLSDVAKQAELGLVPFLLFSALGGLSALVMPCVWPMVPITVNFFVKQGQKKGRTTGLAVVYCLAIIGVFTSIGVLCSFVFSATALQNLANNAWLNVAVAMLFAAFGLSLLGVFEISLPSFLLNASAKGESRGGLVGVMFMALTLTITSFTCTFPVVGGLIVMASKGQFFYPVVGLGTFSAVLALPFFFLALSPGLVSKMPKSGDWMNAVKIVGGLIEVGAAFKFLNTAEIGFGAIPEEAWFNAPVVLSIWVVLAAVCGLYLLGLFRTNHDYEEVRVGPGRILTGALFLGIALFLAPVLFGRPPESRIWYTLVGLLPPDASSFVRPAAGALASDKVAGCQDVKARANDPETAEREEKKCHGVQWGLSLAAAKEQARAEGRPILIDFTGVNCANCRTMESGVMPRPEIVALMQRFVPVELFTDFVPIGTLDIEQRRELAAKNQELILTLGEASNPFYVAMTPDGKVLSTTAGAMPPQRFADFLEKALAKYAAGTKVAQATARE